MGKSNEVSRPRPVAGEGPGRYLVSKSLSLPLALRLKSFDDLLVKKTPRRLGTVSSGYFDPGR